MLSQNSSLVKAVSSDFEGAVCVTTGPQRHLDTFVDVIQGLLLLPLVSGCVAVLGCDSSSAWRAGHGAACWGPEQRCLCAIAGSLLCLVLTVKWWILGPY